VVRGIQLAGQVLARYRDLNVPLSAFSPEAGGGRRSAALFDSLVIA
jgi:hypothetical protein